MAIRSGLCSIFYLVRLNRTNHYRTKEGRTSPGPTAERRSPPLEMTMPRFVFQYHTTQAKDLLTACAEKMGQPGS